MNTSVITHEKANFLDPGTGRFISQDPVGFYGGDYNLYRYCLNNSVNCVDPYGENPLVLIGIGAFIGGVGSAIGHSIGDDRATVVSTIQAFASGAFGGAIATTVAIGGTGAVILGTAQALGGLAIGAAATLITNPSLTGFDSKEPTSSSAKNLIDNIIEKTSLKQCSNE